MAARQHLTNAVLLAALSATAAYLVFTREAPTTKETEAREHSALRVFRRDAVTELSFERDGTAFRLTRAASNPDAGPDARGWTLSWNGKAERADSFAVDRALANLDYAAYERTIKAEEVNRAQFGLEPPRFRVTLTMGALRTTFALGGAAPRPEGAVYADDNGTVRVVKRSALEALDVAPEAFLSRNLVPYLSTELSRLTLHHESGEVTLEKLAGLSWKVTSGELAGVRADRFVFDRILTAFADLKADHFLTEEEARKAQHQGQTVVVTMIPADGRPRGLFSVGGPCPGHPDEVVVIRTEPTIMAACSGRGAVDALQRTAEQLADVRVFSLRDDEIEEITMEQGDKKLDLARKDRAWKQRAPVEAEVAADQARALVKALGATRGDRLRREAPEGFAPAARVTVRGPRENEDTRPPETVELSRPGADGSVVVHRLQDGMFLTLTRDQARPFFPRSTALRSTKLIERSIDQARAIRIWQGGEVLQQLSRKSDGTWMLDLPRGYRVDVGVAADITENLLHLSAEQWVADEDDGSFGLAKPRFKAEVTIEEGDAGAKTYTLLLGEVGPTGVYGRLEGVDGVFVVPRTLEGTLTSLAVDLSAFLLPLESTEWLKFKRPEGTTTFEVKRGKLQPPAGVEFLPSRLAALEEGLKDLRAQRVVHLGAARKEEGLDTPVLELVARILQDGKAREVKLRFGASDVLQGASIFYGRSEDVDATYAVPAARVRALLNVL
ncbi:MAG: DUF4340 domain-containing protein [Myxococcales bacterium]|nr:DUF4340 domain-containing protein [Polyangiaceae bacterium]MDW8250599.1 DUF4340 domain-containing protein [Myxococcales bacterium]